MQLGNKKTSSKTYLYALFWCLIREYILFHEIHFFVNKYKNVEQGPNIFIRMPIKHIQCRLHEAGC